MGPYQEAPHPRRGRGLKEAEGVPRPVAQYQPGPMHSRRDPLYAAYEDAQVRRAFARGVAMDEVRRWSDRRAQAIRAAAAQRKRVAQTMSPGKPRAAWREAARSASQRDWAGLRKERAARQEHVAKEFGRQSWLEWLQGQAQGGDVRALRVLRARSERKSWQGMNGVVVVARVDGFLFGVRVESVSKLGTVVYRVDDHSRIRDDGRSLSVAGRPTDHALAALLVGAKEKHGRIIGVQGGDEFKARLVQVAARFELDITFADEAMEASRKSMIGAGSHERQAQGAGRVHSAGDAYVIRRIREWGARLASRTQQRNPRRGARGREAFAPFPIHRMPGLHGGDVDIHAERRPRRKTLERGQQALTAGRATASRTGVLLQNKAPAELQQRPAQLDQELRRAADLRRRAIVATQGIAGIAPAARRKSASKKQVQRRGR